MRKKISIVLFIIIFGTICVSYIKNKTRDLEKEILKLKQEQTDLVEKLKNEKLERSHQRRQWWRRRNMVNAALQARQCSDRLLGTHTGACLASSC
jgi:hypothetical protein